MYYEFVDSCVYSHHVDASNRDAKKIRFVPDTIRENALLAINTQDGVVDFSLKSDTPEQDRTLKQPEDIRFMALLQQQFQERISESTLRFAFGVADGPVEQGEPTTAAVLQLTFSADGLPSDYVPYQGPKIPIDEQWIDGGWVLTLQNGLTAPSGSTNCRIEALPPTQPDPDIELSAVVHVLDSNGDLLCVIEGQQNNDIMLRYAPEDRFMLVCLVKYSVAAQSPRPGAPIDVTFAIGDPRVDAKVTVTEDDTAADLFQIFSQFFRNLARWFRSLFSS